MLQSFLKGNKKIFSANTKHPLFSDIHNIILKYVGIDHIIDKVVTRLGKVERVYLAGDLSKGLDSKIIDLIFIGDIDKKYLINLIDKVENMISRKIRYLIYSEVEIKDIDWSDYEIEPLMVWTKD